MSSPDFSFVLKRFSNIDTRYLCQLNPDYSCITCANTHCKFHNQPNSGCPDHKYCDQLTTKYIIGVNPH